MALLNSSPLHLHSSSPKSIPSFNAQLAPDDDAALSLAKKINSNQNLLDWDDPGGKIVSELKLLRVTQFIKSLPVANTELLGRLVKNIDGGTAACLFLLYLTYNLPIEFESHHQELYKFLQNIVDTSFAGPYGKAPWPWVKHGHHKRLHLSKMPAGPVEGMDLDYVWNKAIALGINDLLSSNKATHQT